MLSCRREQSKKILAPGFTALTDIHHQLTAETIPHLLWLGSYPTDIPSLRTINAIWMKLFLEYYY